MIDQTTTLFEAFGDRIFVRPTRNARVTEGGIHLPDTVTEEPNEGEVISIGPQVSTGVRVGMRVIFAALSGLNMQLDNENFIIIRERDILAVRT